MLNGKALCKPKASECFLVAAQHLIQCDVGNKRSIDNSIFRKTCSESSLKPDILNEKHLYP